MAPYWLEVIITITGLPPELLGHVFLRGLKPAIHSEIEIMDTALKEGKHHQTPCQALRAANSTKLANYLDEAKTNSKSILRHHIPTSDTAGDDNVWLNSDKFAALSPLICLEKLDQTTGAKSISGGQAQPYRCTRMEVENFRWTTR